MKGWYKINEISRLYGIGADSLRYYEELGILKPKRADNGYRLYGMKDIYKLNVIKDLRQFGFPMKRIKEYLDNKTVRTTLELLREEERLIESEMKHLREQRKNVRTRISLLAADSSEETGGIKLIRCDERRCVKLDVVTSDDEELDFAFNRLNRRFDHKIYAMADYMMGASQSVAEIREGRGGVFRSVFFVLEPGAAEFDCALPGGDYLSLCYRGGYGSSARRMKEVVDYALKSGMTVASEIIELYRIDVHETNDAAEFLTEIQLKIDRQ